MAKEWRRFQVLFEEKDAAKIEKIAASQERTNSELLRFLVKRALALEM